MVEFTMNVREEKAQFLYTPRVLKKFSKNSYKITNVRKAIWENKSLLLNWHNFWIFAFLVSYPTY